MEGSSFPFSSLAFATGLVFLERVAGLVPALALDNEDGFVVARFLGCSPSPLNTIRSREATKR